MSKVAQIVQDLMYEMSQDKGLHAATFNLLSLTPVQYVLLTVSNRGCYLNTHPTFSLCLSLCLSLSLSLFVAWKKADLIGVVIKDRCTFIPFESPLICL